VESKKKILSVILISSFLITVVIVLIYSNSNENFGENGGDESIENKTLSIKNYYPSFNPTITETESQKFNITTFNPDNNQLNYTWYLNESQVGGNLNTYEFIADYDSSGIYTVEVIVTDGKYFVTHLWTLNVSNVNQAPEKFDVFPWFNPKIKETESQEFNITASDPDDDILEYSWYFNEMQIGGNSDTYIFNADYDSSGIHAVKVIVSDGECDIEHLWTLNVSNVNRALEKSDVFPWFNPKISIVGTQKFNITASDPDDDLLDYMWYLNESQVGGNSDTYIFNADYDSIGTYIVKAIVTDGEYAVEHLWTLNVTNPPYKLKGINFSPYTEEGQDPNLLTVISEEQIRALLTHIQPFTEWIRTFGSTHGLENTGRIAHELGLKIAVGAWLSDDLVVNEEQISNLITIAQNGEADMLIVGSEVLLREDLTENQLIEYIDRVKQDVPSIPVATADIYGELLEHPAVMAACDVILANYYPYWEGVSLENAIYHIHLRHQEVVAAANGKQVIVSETGWPSDGNSVYDAVPSPENAAFYFLNFVSWAKDLDVSYFYFEAFNEPWKANYDEGPQGAHWGLWDNDKNLKSGMEKVFNNETTPENWWTGIIDGPGDPTIEFTYVPPYGSYANLQGRVSHIMPAYFRVAVYIKVAGGWWTKPYWNNPLTIINPDGTWICDITTGGIDQLATEIVAYLLPVGYYPPSMSGGSSLPSELDTVAANKTSVVRS